MAKMNSKFKYMYDAAPSITLARKDHAARTASFNAEPIVLDKVGGYWNKDEVLADTTFTVAVNVENLDTTAGNETYKLELEFGPEGFATSTKAYSLTVKAPGQYVFLVDIDTVKAAQKDVAAMRLVGTLGGTTPSITLHSWIAGGIIR